MTCSWLERELQMKHQTCSARLTELYEAGKIVSGGYLDNETLWQIAPLGTKPVTVHRCETCGHKL